MKIARILAALIVALGASAALAQTYPIKPVRVIVPFTPGSGQDIFARVVCQKLSELWGQQVLVENRPGAGGSIASGVVAKSPPDGHMLLWHSTAFATNAALYPNLPYDSLRDFAAISPLVRQPFALVVSPAVGVRTIAELVAAAKAKSGQITYGSAGTGSGTHFAAEKFRLATGIDAVHVPYKGGPEVNADVIAGRVTYWFAPIVMAAPNVRDGKLRALGVTSAQRSGHLPEVPTIAEAGLPAFDYTLWSGLWAPAGTPADLVEKLSKDAARALAEPELRERLANLGAEPMAMTPAEFAQFVRSEIEDSTRIVKAAGIRAQ
jgi:tripartite-type tricarboxylate transporter receptor subunit TctC